MNDTIPQIDIPTARQAYSIPRGDNRYQYNPFTDGGFSKYSPAYVLSNENLRWITGLTAKMAHKVLTTTGSGDQAMFYAMNGATEIDTFDISYCAQVISEIKTAAMTTFSRPKYFRLLDILHKSANFTTEPLMENIIPSISPACAKFISNMNGCMIFNNGLNPTNYADFLPDENEYSAMQSMAQSGSFSNKFIWSDVETLHTHLTSEYDVINLSNIFQYLSAEQIFQTLESLRNYIRINGYIIVHSGAWGIHRNSDIYRAAQEKFKTWAKIGIAKENPTMANCEQVAILQRTR